MSLYRHRIQRKNPDSRSAVDVSQVCAAIKAIPIIQVSMLTNPFEVNSMQKLNSLSLEELIFYLRRPQNYL